MAVIEQERAAPTGLLRTPDQILGPFYPVQQQPSLSGDLTRDGRAQGTVLLLSGRVLTGTGSAGAGGAG
jgi:protocatechuate 3,4-dioxygenase beta subunit